MKNTEWFKFLSQDEQRRFMINLSMPMFMNENNYSETFQDFIGKAFIWCSSPEGFFYWVDIHDRVVGYLPTKKIKKLDFI